MSIVLKNDDLRHLWAPGNADRFNVYRLTIVLHGHICTFNLAIE